jgi:hypothetical protein
VFVGKLLEISPEFVDLADEVVRNGNRYHGDALTMKWAGPRSPRCWGERTQSDGRGLSVRS